MMDTFEKWVAPFDEAAQIMNPITHRFADTTLFPAFYQTRRSFNTLPTSTVTSTPNIDHCRLRRIDMRCRFTVREYLQESFDVERLNEVQSWLWVAGLPKIARPLHKQLSKCRSIVVTEQADCHLVWQDDTLLVKPLPEYLLVIETWQNHLAEKDHIRKSAISFALSYLWLICEYSDFCIAKQYHLLPAFVEWHQWTTFAASLYDHLYRDGELVVDILPRYQYGELRLRRLSHIYRLRALRPQNFRSEILIHGYREMYTTYASFLQNNTRWLITAVIYIGMVLTAMQVALGTGHFDTHSYFSTICVNFSMFTILAPLSLLGITVLVLMVSFGLNAKYAFCAKQRLVRILKEMKQPQP